MSDMGGEVARYWRHPALPEVDLLRARFVTHRFARHTHPGYTIGVIEAGVDEFEHRGGVERAGPGSVAVVNPDVVHTGHAGTPEGWTYRVIYPSVAVVEGIAAELGAPRGTPVFPDAVLDDPSTARLLSALHRAGEAGDALAVSTMLRTALAHLLTRHARHVPGGDGSVAMPPIVREARDLLHARLIDPPSLEKLAEEVGTRPFPLLRAFRTTVGLPPHAYLNQVRVRAARALLDEGLRPAEVAGRTGFADQAHLTRHFKRTVGVPPGAYQSAAQAGRRGR
ncbi:AraC family transcriptional regulator [Actinomadura rubrisoli]|uniref:AraC family transcriptional regulator n=2 Tax=Actinomadura rubrisoli TaxID=2530368 RepID=A0A4R4ZXK1_9ACTN|nr:AraC family transcriptional regulator [Actinomadura rubrisoli]TDD64068.1 AraC family transcriptional regulator [Actinomadura rubrisoli]